ncbi:MAG: hypothetical protein B6242_05990 [Anaerolineaceae bacterium 4572_78]|nr:MAG: hypothetical protein B6242_05990 [Anaerolineaceae bacterium 4572_78]
MSEQMCISFGNNSLAFEYDTPQVKELLYFLYQYIPTDLAIVPHVTYHMTCQNNEYTTYRDEELLYQGNSKAQLCNMLLGDALYQLAYECHAGLFLHAGGVVKQGKSIIFPGSSGAGKTTLAIWLLRQGFDYLTDEAVFIPLDSSMAYGFTRPLNVKTHAKPVLSTLFDFEKHKADILSTSISSLIPPSKFGQIYQPNFAPLKSIIFPKYQAKTEFRLKRLSKAKAGLRLLQTLINARNLPQHGFYQVTRLADMVPMYEMRYANFRQLETVNLNEL